MTATRPVIHRHPDAAALADGAATWIAARLAAAIAARGRAALALAGGNTPRALHARLATAAVDWAAVSIYFGDERCVPPDDAASNYRMAHESLLAAVAPARVVRIEGERGPTEAAHRYDAVLTSAPPLDVIVLGMGDDGHVASWFPGDDAPATSEAQAIASVSPLAPVDRVTMTARAIGAADAVVLLVSGAAKAARLAAVAAEIANGRPRLPAALVTGAAGPPHWFLDDAAASALPVSLVSDKELS